MFDVPWGEVLRNTFLPLIENDFNFYMIAVAFLGTTVTPFLIFWQTTQVIEDRKSEKDLSREQSAVNWGMVFCQIITFFIVITGAAAFAGKYGFLLGTAGEVAESLAPFGKWALPLFSVGILGAGFIAVPVLAATTGYVMSETLQIESGLSKSFKRARGFYLAIIFSIVVGIGISLSGYNPITMLVYSQVLNGIFTPILIIFLLMICNRKKLMGNYRNGFWTNLLGILTALFMAFFAMMMIIQYIK
jgi:Mn2+/Fe2+ NRAMP family transporter